MKKISWFLVMLLCLGILVGCKKEETEETSGTITETGQESGNLELTDAVEDKFVVYVDPGHGFDDPGCSSELLDGVESENTLEIAMILKEKLEAAGAEVVLTHDGKTYPTAQSIRDLADKHGVTYDPEKIITNNIFSAYERAVYTTALSEEADIDFFVSLHINSVDGYPERSRYELYYCENNPFAAELGEMCTSLGAKLDNLTYTSAMPYDDAYAVVKYAPVPSLLVEMGYSTNEADAAKLNSESWRQSFCEILAKEIMIWKEMEQ